jgi:4-amino-4-deoxy-L-arabinose transferase-like glycosyltransferase
MAALASEFLGLEGDEKLVKIIPNTPATVALVIYIIVALALWGLFLITIGAISKASQSPTSSRRSPIIDSVLLTLPLMNVYWSARWARQVLKDGRSGHHERRLVWLFSSISLVDTLFCLVVLISAIRYTSLIEAVKDQVTATVVDISSVNALAFLLVFFGAWMIARMQSLGPALEDSSTDSGHGDSSRYSFLKLS